MRFVVFVEGDFYIRSFHGVLSEDIETFCVDERSGFVVGVELGDFEVEEAAADGEDFEGGECAHRLFLCLFCCAGERGGANEYGADEAGEEGAGGVLAHCSVDLIGGSY